MKKIDKSFGITGGPTEVLACPVCGSTACFRTFDLGTGEPYPNAGGHFYKCGLGHRFDAPETAIVETYDPEPHLF